jgi:hypothetical protein
MNPLLLAAILTIIYGAFAVAFVRQRARGVIVTRMGDVSKRKSPRHFAVLEWFNIVMFPVGGLMLVLLWAGAISRTFQ